MADFYLASSNIAVFPSSRRAVNGVDVKARQFSEETISGITTNIVDSTSYVVSFTTASTNYNFEFIINGYYFNTQIPISSVSGALYASIQMDDSNDFIELQGIDEDSQYKGVVFSDTAKSSPYISLQLLTSSGEVPDSSYFKFSDKSLNFDIDGGTF